MKKLLKDIRRQAKMQYESSPEGRRRREEIQELEEECRRNKERAKQARKKTKELMRTLRCTDYLSMHVDEIDFDAVDREYPKLREEDPSYDMFLRKWAEHLTPERKKEIEEWYAQLKPEGKSREYIRKFIPNCK